MDFVASQADALQRRTGLGLPHLYGIAEKHSLIILMLQIVYTSFANPELWEYGSPCLGMHK